VTTTGICTGKGDLGDDCSNSTQCLSQFCALDDATSQGVCCDSACNGSCNVCSAANGATDDGTCTVLEQGNIGLTDCGLNLCNGVDGTCPSSCAADSDCDTGGTCTDGVCCGTACDGECEACSEVLTGVEDGICSPVIAGDTDPSAGAGNACVSGADCVMAGTGAESCACDGTTGAGSCKRALGELSGDGADCASGLATDGVCCDVATCAGTCESCAAAGVEGTCQPVGSGTTDAADGNPTCGTEATQCSGDDAADCTCDGAGSCVTLQGQECTMDSQCLDLGNGSFCVDDDDDNNGVCCDVACDTSCFACEAAQQEAANAGTCGFSAANATDGGCDSGGTQACDGAGVCKAAQGQTCMADGDCGSGFCVDDDGDNTGVCCDTDCTGECQACEAAEQETPDNGVCGDSAAGQGDETTCDDAGDCGGDSCACDDTGSCLEGLGSGCTDGTECASGECVDGVCCADAACGTCEACDLAGSLGTCTTVDDGVDDADSCDPAANYCEGGACKTDITQGSPCVNNYECGTGAAFCANNVCCNAVCDGPCESCLAADTAETNDGTCATINMGTDPDQECASGQGCCSGGSCTAGACIAGESCDVDEDCTSNFCGNVMPDVCDPSM